MAGSRETTVQVECNAAVATVWLNRPSVRNAFDQTMIGELTQAFAELSRDAGVRVIVLAARGTMFCAGGDLNWMKASAAYSEAENRADAEKLARMLQAVNVCSKPVIARVQGDAYGGGLGLVAASDIAVCAAESQFVLSEVRIGLIPATIGPYVLAAIGPRAASRYMLTAERISAAEAHRIGLVHEAVPYERLDACVESFVRSLLAVSPEAVSASKRLIREISGRPVDDALISDTAARIAAARASADGREGIDAFLNKRKPAWAR